MVAREKELSRADTWWLIFDDSIVSFDAANYSREELHRKEAQAQPMLPSNVGPRPVLAEPPGHLFLSLF